MYLSMYSAPRDFSLLRAIGVPFVDLPTRAPRNHQPPMEVRTTDNGYEVCVELPGVKKDAVSVQCNARTLTIVARTLAEGKSAKDAAGNGAAADANTRRRALQLPDAVEIDDIRAEYRDGMLRITLPYAREAQARAIPIQ